MAENKNLKVCAVYYQKGYDYYFGKDTNNLLNGIIKIKGNLTVEEAMNLRNYLSATQGWDSDVTKLIPPKELKEVYCG